MSENHLTAPTRFIKVDGDSFAYRRWGNPTAGSVPLFFLQHFRGGMDNWDPHLTDGLAAGREVILFNGRGIASSLGTPRNRIEDMADDIAAVIRSLGACPRISRSTTFCCFSGYKRELPILTYMNKCTYKEEKPLLQAFSSISDRLFRQR